MKLTKTMLAIFAIIATAGLMLTLTVVESDAYHSQFLTKKECTNFMKTVLGNTTAEANIMCMKVIPH